MTAVEIVYLICGFVLPLFYLPQILRLHTDSSNLSSYSLSKAVIQWALRLPALAFGIQIENSLFVVCVLMDLAGRLCEISFAIQALHRQGNSLRQMASRLNPMAAHPPRHAKEILQIEADALQPTRAEKHSRTGSNSRRKSYRRRKFKIKGKPTRRGG